MNEHVSEYRIEQLLIAPEALDAEQKETIERHFEACELCGERYLAAKRFYDTLGHGLESPPSERDRNLAERILRRHYRALPTKALKRKSETEIVNSALETYAGIIEPYRRPVVQRFMRYVLMHPVRFASGLSFAMALAALTFFIVQPKKDVNPAYARAKSEFLITYNQTGEELWRKHVGPGYDIDKAPPHISTRPEQGSPTVDVDGDGTNEVLAIFGWLAQDAQSRNAVICFNADGGERWRYEFHRTISFGGKVFLDDYRFQLITVADHDRDGRIEALAEATHIPWYPCAVVKLDARTGSFISEYWHPGSVLSFAHRDIDGDGVEELFFAGQNNRYERASLVVLDPRLIDGHSPLPPTYRPEGIPAGAEKYYILFPPSDLQKFWGDIANEVVSLELRADGLIEVYVVEKIVGDLIYYFDSSLRCVDVRASDAFVGYHRKLEAEGKVTKKVDQEYLEDLRQRVSYWDGEKFVSQPTMNRRYLESLQPKVLP